jgi:beta-galactosidase GanA
MQKIIDNEFVYGTQYYRAPTPLPQEWEMDMVKMDSIGIDTIQLRVQWRKNEPREDEYYFDDIDDLFALAQKHRRKVIFKFLMENAPDYIYEKYHGHRQGLNGESLNPGAHGAFYIGGWLPCFDNPEVVQRAKKFVRVMVERYKHHDNLILWNIWNEPRSRPLCECVCGHSVNSYREWLRRNFSDINELNDKFGKGWESFETIHPPSMPHDYAELYLWRTWSFDAVASRLRFMYDTVAEHDNSRPIISHVGGASIVQDSASDGSDDVLNNSIVDFYGTSLPTAPHINNIIDETQPLIICDWLYSVCGYYWVYELYPDWGDWNEPISVEDYLFKVYLSIACGAKGLLFWQYRAERLGCENNLGGLVNIDGSFRNISYESAKAKEFISENEEFLCNASVVYDEIGILYSQKSDLISRVENTGKGLFNFDLNCNGTYLYNKSVQGIYALFRELDLNCELIDSRMLEEKLKHIKVLYIPEAFILTQKETELITDFVNKGGFIIAEEGIGLRQENTWLNYPWPGSVWREIFGLEILQRTHKGKAGKDKMKFNGIEIPAGEFTSRINCTDAELLGTWSNGSGAVAQRGNCIYLGTSLGEAFFDHYDSHYDQYVTFLQSIMERCPIRADIPKLPKGVYRRQLEANGQVMYFIFNRSTVKQEIKLNGELYKMNPKETKIVKNIEQSNKIQGGRNVSIFEYEINNSKRRVS